MTVKEFAQRLEKTRQYVKDVESGPDKQVSENDKEAIASFHAFDSAFSLISELCAELNIEVTSVVTGLEEDTEKDVKS